MFHHCPLLRPGPRHADAPLSMRLDTRPTSAAVPPGALLLPPAGGTAPYASKREQPDYDAHMSTAHGGPEKSQSTKADRKAAKAYAKATRPWYKKKRWWAAGLLQASRPRHGIVRLDAGLWAAWSA